MECEFCQNHEQGDTLYESSDWDGGIGFDYIRDIKYCPLCGSLLDGETKDELQTETLEQFRVGLEYYTDTTHFGKVKGESITTNKTESQIEYDEYREKIRAHDPHKDW